MRRDDDRFRAAGQPETDAGPRPTRRGVLAGAGAALGSAMAGCAALPGGGSTDDRAYERLHLTAVYVDDGVDLSVPDELQTVRATTNADLLVLPADTGTDAGQAVEWLADDRVVALLGDGAEATWLDWARSDAYGDAFGEGGTADAEPDPYLLVAGAVGLDVSTYRHSWSDGPRDRDVLRALDEVLVDLESKTPA